MSQEEARALLAAMRTQHMERIADVIEEALDEQLHAAEVSEAEAIIWKARKDEVVQDWKTALGERDNFRADSVTLNSIGWKLAQALGDAGPDDTETYGDPEEQLDRLIVERNTLRTQVKAQQDSHNRQMNAYAVETENLRQLLHAKESWIEGAKTDMQSLEDEVSRLARPGGLRLVSELTLARNEFARLRNALVEIVNVLGPDEVLAGEGLVHEAHDALRAAKEALR